MSFRGGRSRPRFSYRGFAPSSASSPSSPLSSLSQSSISGSQVAVTSDDHPFEQQQQQQILERRRSPPVPVSFRMNFYEYPECEEHSIVKKSEYEPGIIGRKIELLANYLRINAESKIIYQYNIEFRFKDDDKYESKISIEENERMQKFFARISSLLVEKFLEINAEIFNSIDNEYIYDAGKSIYTIREIKTEYLIKEFDYVLSRKQAKSFIVLFNKVQIIDLAQISQYYSGRIEQIPEITLKFFELLIQNICSKQFKQHRRNLFNVNDNNLIESKECNWLKFVRGFSSSVARTQFGPSLNLHLKTTCIISTNVEKLSQLLMMMLKISNIQHIRDIHLVRVNKLLRGLKVFSNHQGGKTFYKISQIVLQRPNQTKFTMKSNNNKDTGDIDSESVEINIEDYFYNKYNIELEDNPIVVKMMGPSNLFMPIELLMMVENQFFNETKLEAEMQNDLLQASTNKPLRYFNHLAKFAHDIHNSNPDKMYDFGMNLSLKPVKFFGRVIDAPKLIGGNRTDRFAYVLPFEWAFFSFDEYFNQDDINDMVKKLIITGRRFGMNFGKCLEKRVIPINKDNIYKLKDVFANILLELPSSCNLFIIIIPDKVANLYNIIKHLCDQQYGIITQCMNTIKAKRCPRGYIENLLLKINGKIGGHNSYIHSNQLESLPFDHSKTMIFGVDVNHSGGNDRIKCSIACVVGSYDQCFTKYSASIRQQKLEREEIISTIDVMIDELLIEYEKYNKYYPTNFIVFRDGISDGQFELAQDEISLIRRAIRLRVGNNSKLLYIVTQKRHQTRFALTKPTGQPDRPVYNVPSGTVVDHTITDPNQCVFYINSHFSALGTSRPSKYVILRNDFDRKTMNMDVIEKFCFYLCHNCTRFRGPISIPVPIRYADLCAYRSRLHLEAQKSSYQNISTTMEFEKQIIENLNQMIKVNDKIKNRLYYC